MCGIRIHKRKLFIFCEIPKLFHKLRNFLDEKLFFQIFRTISSFFNLFYFFPFFSYFFPILWLQNSLFLENFDFRSKKTLILNSRQFSDRNVQFGREKKEKKAPNLKKEISVFPAPRTNAPNLTNECVPYLRVNSFFTIFQNQFSSNSPHFPSIFFAFSLSSNTNILLNFYFSRNPETSSQPTTEWQKIAKTESNGAKSNWKWFR